MTPYSTQVKLLSIRLAAVVQEQETTIVSIADLASKWRLSDPDEASRKLKFSEARLNAAVERSWIDDKLLKGLLSLKSETSGDFADQIVAEARKYEKLGKDISEQSRVIIQLVEEWMNDSSASFVKDRLEINKSMWKKVVERNSIHKGLLEKMVEL